MQLCKIDGASQGAFIDDEFVMIHSETGKFFSIKGTALEVWNMLDSESDLEAIRGELERRFEVDPEACRIEVGAFVDQLVEAGFARYC